MPKIITLQYANEAGVGVVYSDGSSVKWIAHLDKTVITDSNLDQTIVAGRVGI